MTSNKRRRRSHDGQLVGEAVHGRAAISSNLRYSVDPKAFPNRLSFTGDVPLECERT